MAAEDDRTQDKLTPMNRPWLFGVPAWAWITGWMIGLAIAIPMFDNLIVAVMFAFSIGTAFAIAFAPSARKKAPEADEPPA